jgi:hypothetical protein
MERFPVVVVAETPTLGAAVHELLQSDGLDSHEVSDLAAAERELATRPAPRRGVVVVAANEAHCRTVRQWPSSAVHGLPLVVIGARDVSVGAVPGLHLVSLPLDPPALIALVRSLQSGPSRWDPRYGRAESGAVAPGC